MTNHTIETVMFKLKDEIATADFLQAADAITTFAKAQPGFVARRLSVNEDGLWIEHVEWKSLKDAQSAAAAIMSDPQMGPVMGMIDAESVQMHHSKLGISVN